MAKVVLCLTIIFLRWKGSGLQWMRREGRGVDLHIHGHVAVGFQGCSNSDRNTGGERTGIIMAPPYHFFCKAVPEERKTDSDGRKVSPVKSHVEGQRERGGSRKGRQYCTLGSMLSKRPLREQTSKFYWSAKYNTISSYATFSVQ